MLGDRDREAEEHRGFAIAPYGDGWEVTYERFIRRVFPTKRKAIRWIDRRIGHGPAPRGIARRLLDRLIGYEPPNDWRRFPEDTGSA